MFAIMDTNQELLSIAHTDKQELENLWMQAKDELKLTKQVRRLLVIGDVCAKVVYLA